MLVNTRRNSEKLIIGRPGQVLTEPIVVMVCAAHEGRAKIGVQAQRDIPIHREELLLRRDTDLHEQRVPELGAVDIIGANVPSPTVELIQACDEVSKEKNV